MAVLHLRAEHSTSLLKDSQALRRREDTEMDNVE